VADDTVALVADQQLDELFAIQDLAGQVASVNVRLEVPQDDGERLDVLCFGDHGSTAVELKYFTAPWSGLSPAKRATRSQRRRSTR